MLILKSYSSISDLNLSTYYSYINKNPNIEFLFIISIRNIWSRYTSYGIIKCNEKLAFSSEKRAPSTDMYGHNK